MNGAHPGPLIPTCHMCLLGRWWDAGPSAGEAWLSEDALWKMKTFLRWMSILVSRFSRRKEATVIITHLTYNLSPQASFSNFCMCSLTCKCRHLLYLVKPLVSRNLPSFYLPNSIDYVFLSLKNLFFNNTGYS